MAYYYHNDESDMTVRQVWSYGNGRGGETYSRIVSKVSYSAGYNNVLFTPGTVSFSFGGDVFGKVIEVGYGSREVLFEATLRPPIAPFNITFRNVQRMSLYPE